MSRLFDNLRSRLAEAFNLMPDTPCQLPDARGLTLTAYLPDEERAIEAVFAVTQVHKIAAATAHRIEEPDELSRARGMGWSLAMTFYVAAAEREQLEAETSAILASLGGSLAREQPTPLGRQAA
jgi:hypothetical protein